jgi:hypothetical protein
MVPPDMIDAKSNPILARSHLTTEQANILRKKARTEQAPAQGSGPFPSDNEDEFEEELLGSHLG